MPIQAFEELIGYSWAFPLHDKVVKIRIWRVMISRNTTGDKSNFLHWHLNANRYISILLTSKYISIQSVSKIWLCCSIGKRCHVNIVKIVHGEDSCRLNDFAIKRDIFYTCVMCLASTLVDMMLENVFEFNTQQCSTQCSVESRSDK